MKRTFYILSAIVIILAAYVIPYFIPITDVTSSLSYQVGFNNKAGLLILLLGCLWMLAFGFFKEKNVKKITLFDFSGENQIGKKAIWIITAINLVYIFAVQILGGQQIIRISEYGYFMPHVYDVLAGKTPFVDFQYIYGPLYAYLPVALYKAIPLISIEWSYTIVLIIFHVSGLWMIWELLNVIKLSYKQRFWLLVLLSIYFFQYSFGLNAATARVIISHWLLLKLYLCNNRGNKIGTALYSIAGIVVCFGISSEIGIAFLLGCSTYLTATAIFEKRSYIFPVILATLACVGFMLWLLPDYFNATISNMKGTSSFPFVPCIPLSAYFIALMIAAWIAGIYLQQIERMVFPLSFILLSAVYAPVALSRCDPFHVLNYGLFVIIVSYIALQRISPKVNKVANIVIILFIAITGVQNIKYAIVTDATAIVLNHSKNIYKCKSLFSSPVIQAKFEKLKSKSESPIIPFDIDKSESVSLPFFNRIFYVELNRNYNYKGQYYTHIAWNGFEEAVERIISDLSSNSPKYLILPTNWEDFSGPDNLEIINSLFFSYYPVKARNNTVDIHKPLKDFIKENYSQKEATEYWLLYEMNNTKENKELEEDRARTSTAKERKRPKTFIGK